MVLTAVLADATNLGLTRMAEACSVASYKQLAWTAGWYVSEEAYGRALARGSWRPSRRSSWPPTSAAERSLALLWQFPREGAR